MITEAMNQKELEKYITLSSIPIRSIGAYSLPTGLASACIFDYNRKRILLTVHHATGDMANWGIQVRFEPGKGTEIKLLGSMYFLKSININTSIAKDIDFAYVEIPSDIEPVSQEIDGSTGAIRSETKRLFSKINFDKTPDINELYGFSGEIMPELIGSILMTESRTYTNLKYIGDEDDYYIFELPFNHPGHEHFRGCSGAPILDTKGDVVALVCKGDIVNNRVYGISLKKYETAINATYGKLSEIA
jgi:hypothetical protein